MTICFLIRSSTFLVFAIALTLSFYLPNPCDFTYLTMNIHFIILSSIIVLSLPWFIRFSQTRGSSLASNTTPRHATFTDGQHFLFLYLRSFIIFVILWLPYAAFSFFIFTNRDISLKGNSWLFPSQNTIHLLAFFNSSLNPILYLYTYSFGKLVWRHFRSRRENKMESTITIRALRGKEGTRNQTSLSNTVWFILEFFCLMM